jgi:subtilisin family serine protease
MPRFPRRRPIELSSLFRLDSLESRVLLSMTGDTSMVTFRGVTAEAVTGSYNVVVKPGVDFLRLASRAPISNITDLGRGYYNFSTTWSPSKVSSWARDLKGRVQAISPNYLSRPAAVPNDTLYAANQYYLNNTGQLNPNPEFVPIAGDRIFGTPGEDIDAQRAWDITTGSSDVVIAVLDTGLDIAHPDLAANVWTNPNEVPNDGIDNDGNGFIDDINGWDFFGNDADVTDFGGHGTNVSGVIAAVGNNGLGIAGVSWNAKILTVKVFDDVELALAGTSTAIQIQAVNYVMDLKLSGINIAAMNLSLGGFGINFDPAYARLIDEAKAVGIVYVAAAGNDAFNIDRQYFSPAREGFKANSLVVAATDNTGGLAEFSNFGNSTVQVAAPGVQIFTTHSQDAINFPGAYTDPVNGGAYSSVDGTSFASPVVAGIVALAKSAFPNATPDQIISAVMNGSDTLPSLNGATPNAPKKVITGGRVNAYNTLQLLSASVVSTNAVSSGDWRGRYGSTASFIYGGTTGTPTFPGLTSSLTPDGSTVTESRVRAGSTAGPLFPEGDQRSNSTLISEQTMAFQFDFTTLGSQQLTLYFADLDRRNRAQSIVVRNTDTGLLLSQTSYSRFQNGQYVTLQLSGRVTIEVTPTRGDAALNALFLDPVPVNTAAVVSTDTLTGGNWINVYGDLGQVLPGQTSSAPAFATVSTEAPIVIGRTSRDVLLPESLLSTRNRSTGVYSNGTGSPFDLTVNVTGGERQVSFYTAQTARSSRIQRFQVINPANGQVVAQQDVTLSKSGAYVTFSLTGNNIVRVHTLGGGAASVAGIFFNSVNTFAAPTATSGYFLDSNKTLGGKWRGQYGQNGQFVVGASTSFPSFVSSTPTPTNGTFAIINPNTRNPAAPTNPNLVTGGGIVGYLQTTSTTDLPININDGSTRRLTVYATDFDRKNRVQRLELIDPATGAVLSSQVVRQFQKGVYVSWSVSGNVTLRMTRLDGPSAVLSAIYFD